MQGAWSFLLLRFVDLKLAPREIRASAVRRGVVERDEQQVRPRIDDVRVRLRDRSAAKRGVHHAPEIHKSAI